MKGGRPAAGGRAVLYVMQVVELSGPFDELTQHGLTNKTWRGCATSDETSEIGAVASTPCLRCASEHRARPVLVRSDQQAAAHAARGLETRQMVATVSA